MLDSVASEIASEESITDAPILMLISKGTNEIVYWKLTEKVQSIELINDNPQKFALKLINENPLLIQLWVESGVENVDVKVNFR